MCEVEAGQPEPNWGNAYDAVYGHGRMTDFHFGRKFRKSITGEICVHVDKLSLGVWRNAKFAC